MIRVYGASDDLIEVAGALEAEFYFKDDRHNYLAFSDGTILAAVYDEEGMWRINRIHTGTMKVEHFPAGDIPEDEHDCPEYSDLVRLDGPGAHWVVFGHEKVWLKNG